MRIDVTTARPIVIPDPDGSGPEIRRYVIEVKTRDKSVADQQLVMTWFPYCFDWLDWSEFKGHRNRTLGEARTVRARVYRGEIPLADYLRSRRYRDFDEADSEVFTAYLPDPKRDDNLVWTGRRSKGRANRRAGQTDAWEPPEGRADRHAEHHDAGELPEWPSDRHGAPPEARELLAFGLCRDRKQAEEDILRERSIAKLISDVDERVFYRYWKNHPFCRPRRLNDQLLDPERYVPILRTSIRKALAGPVRNQASFVGWPVATWATSVFLGALYNLNRRKEMPGAIVDEASDRGIPREQTRKEAPDFERQLAGLVIALSEREASLDTDGLLRVARDEIRSASTNDRVGALALIVALGDFARVASCDVELMQRLAQEDPDPDVRDAARLAAKLVSGARSS